MRQREDLWIRKLGGWITCFLFMLLLSATIVHAETQGTLDVTVNTSQTTCSVCWSYYQMPSDGEALTLAVWSDKNGQDDLKWRELSYSNGAWRTSFSISDHATEGDYLAHLYLRTKTGKMIFLTAKTFTVDAATCTDVSVEDLNEETGTCKVVISGLTSPSGITNVVVPTWCSSDQSDLVWYPATKQSDGTWIANVRFSRHSYHSGTYNFHVYATSGNKIFNFVKGTTAEYTYTKPEVKLTADMQTTTCDLKATGLVSEEGIKEVLFIVWSDTDGQDDIVWNSVSCDNGTAEKTINLKDYCDYGTYHFHVYIKTDDGELVFMGYTTFDVPYPSVDNVDVTTNGSAFSVTVSGLHCVSGIDKVTIPIWSKPDQSDLVWYRAVKQSDGSYKVSSDISKHNNNTGVYSIHVYVDDDRDSYGYNVAQKTMSFQRSAGELTITSSEDKQVITAEIDSLSIPESHEILSLAVWSDNNGQDDLKWYETTENGTSCSISIPLEDHNMDDGIYNLHLYARQSGGKMLFVQSYTFEVNLRNTLFFENQGGGSVDVRVRLSDDITAASVTFPTWCTSDQSDLKWYEGVKQSDGSYKATIDIANHSNRTGTYTVHCYYNDASGGLHFVCGSTVELDNKVTDAYAEIDSCLITGGDTVTVTATVSAGGSFGLYSLNAGSTSISGSPLGTANGSGTITLTAPLNADTSSSLLNKKLVVAQKRNSGYVVISDGKYITNPEAIASETRDFPVAATKKGLQVNTALTEDAADLGVNHAVINVVLNNIPCSSGGISYNYNGKTWHMDAEYISALDETFAEQAANGSIVSAVLLLQWDSEWSDLIIPSGRTAGYSFYGLNAETEDAREQWAAIFSFLANRYSSSTYNVVNWILGNEVDDYTHYYWCGNCSLSQYATYYADAFRLLYNSVKSQYSNARVYISLDHIWNYYRSYGFTGKELMDAFTSQLQSEGDITWNIAYHPYPNPLTSANFWKNTTGVSYSSTSAVYTMLNLSSLTDYIKNTYGSQHRFILSETGFTSVSDGTSDEKLQAAAIAYGYYLAEFNDMVDSFVVHRHVDHPVETSQGLYLGLWYTNSSTTDSPSTKKFAWTIYKYMDTSQGAAYTNFALSIIGADSWSSIVPGYSASRFS